MQKKYSFSISWLDEEEKFQVKLFYGLDLLEVHTFEWQRDVWEYIADTMSGLQIHGEDWNLTY